MDTSLSNSSGERIVFLDYLRVFACLLVIIVHSCEYFYFGDDLIVNFAPAGADFWVNAINSFCRMSVPLFVMTSSYLLLPLHASPSNFFKKRGIRILLPFIIWSILYAVIPAWGIDYTGEWVKGNLLHLLCNFNDMSGHLWFMYMLIGLYMLMPVISPWLKSCSRRAEEAFLVIWFITTFHHYGKALGIDYFYGECWWNEFGTFWYFSGYIGYLVLAHYIRQYIDWTLAKSLVVGLALLVVGYIATTWVFHARAATESSIPALELSWRFCTFNVVLMTTGAFLIFKKLPFPKGKPYGLVKDVSKLSYGMYLMHMFILGTANQIFAKILPLPLNILVMGVSTFVVCYLIAKPISLMKGGKYIVG